MDEKHYSADFARGRDLGAYAAARLLEVSESTRKSGRVVGGSWSGRTSMPHRSAYVLDMLERLQLRRHGAAALVQSAVIVHAIGLIASGAS